MSALPIREEVIAYLRELSDEDVAKVLAFVKEIKVEAPAVAYDDDNNPLRGFFSAAPDFAEKSEEVLHRELGLHKPGDMQNK
jgi:hypothetical protein